MAHTHRNDVMAIFTFYLSRHIQHLVFCYFQAFSVDALAAGTFLDFSPIFVSSLVNHLKLAGTRVILNPSESDIVMKVILAQIGLSIKV